MIEGCEVTYASVYVLHWPDGRLLSRTFLIAVIVRAMKNKKYIEMFVRNYRVVQYTNEAPLLFREMCAVFVHFNSYRILKTFLVMDY
jgi:hypothetical protein